MNHDGHGPTPFDPRAELSRRIRFQVTTADTARMVLGDTASKGGERRV